MRSCHTVIESLGVYLPPRRVSSQEIVDGCQQKLRFALDLATGIQARRTAGETEFAIDLARKAAEDCLARSRHSFNDIDLLLCTNIARCDAPGQNWTMEPSTSSRLCRDFGLTGILAFDISNACAGMFTGIYLADALLKSGCIDRALVVSGEYITLLAETAQKEITSIRDPRLACLTLGDAGAAVLLERSEDSDSGFLSLELYTLGRFSSLCTAAPSNEPHGGVVMTTDMFKLAEVCQKHGVLHADHLLSRLGWPAQAIDRVIPHQTSKWTLSSLGGSVAGRFPPERIVNNLAERGNTASTTHFVALHDQILNNQIQAGETLMFSINASGATVGTAIYRLDDLPVRLRREQSDTSKRGHEPDLMGGFLAGDGPPQVAISGIGTAFPVDAEPTDSLSLLNKAVARCLQSSNCSPGEIDVIIHTGVYRKDFVMEPAIAAQVAGFAGLNSDFESMETNRTLAFDVFNGGVGFLNACLLGVELVGSQLRRRVLICAAEYENTGPKYQPSDRGVQESASAILLESTQGSGIGFGANYSRLYSEHCDKLNVKISTLTGPPYKLEYNAATELEDLFVVCVQQGVSEFLEVTGRTLSDFDWFLPPQLSGRFLDSLCAALNLPSERVINITSERGDPFSSSFPLCWQHLHRNHPCRSGQECLVINVGSGLQVCCATYRL